MDSQQLHVSMKESTVYSSGLSALFHLELSVIIIE